MRLLLLAWDFYPNTSGGAHARWKFCNTATSLGHDVTVFTPGTGDTSEHEVVNGVTIVRPVDIPNLYKMQNNETLSITERMRAGIEILSSSNSWLSKNSVDGLHSDSHSLNWVGKILSLWHNIKLTNFIGFTPLLKTKSEAPRGNLLEQLSIRYCMGDRVYCRNKKVLNIVEEISSAEGEIIHGVVNEDSVREAAQKKSSKSKFTDGILLPSGNINLVFVGRLANIKNPMLAINIVESLPNNVHLHMIGDGPLRNRLSQEAIINDQVHIVGELSHLRTLRTIMESDALILTSNTESYPTVVFEALSLSTPVFARKVGILTQIEHPRLFLSDKSDMPEVIEANLIHASADELINTIHTIDETTLERYSMKRYTKTILSAYE